MNFFFSSRRRHTRSKRDWSSDVCSSDLAMTRAKDQLDLIVPQRFYTHQQASQGDRHVYACRTRFIPASILARFAARSWPIALAQAEPASAARPQARVDIGARMRGMWR